MLLAAGDVSDQLLIIDTGVVSVTLPHGGQSLEAGRMGPGEVIGEAGVLTGTAWQVQFTALSDGAVYRLDKAVLGPCLEARQEIAEAMTRLLDFRQKASAALLVEQPVVAPQRGLMAWLKQYAGRRYKT